MEEYAVDGSLTAREIDVLQLIAQGNANKLVADQLSITEDTVKAHVKSILSKLGANGCASRRSVLINGSASDS